MAQILEFLVITPFPNNFGSLENALREWQRGFGEVTSESDAATPALERARRGALDIREQAMGIQPKRNVVAQGVSAARPLAEIKKAEKATENGPGVSAKIRKAEKSSDDPNAPVPTFDPNEPLRGVDSALDTLRDHYRQLNREQQAADNAEREYNS